MEFDSVKGWYRSMIDMWSRLNELSDSELKEMCDHLDRLKASDKLYSDEEILKSELLDFDHYVGGLRNQYRWRIIRVANTL